MALQGAVLGALLVFVLPGLMQAARQGGDTGSGKLIPHGLIATGTLIGAGGFCAAGLHAASSAVSP